MFRLAQSVLVSLVAVLPATAVQAQVCPYFPCAPNYFPVLVNFQQVCEPSPHPSPDTAQDCDQRNATTLSTSTSSETQTARVDTFETRIVATDPQRDPRLQGASEREDR